MLAALCVLQAVAAQTDEPPPIARGVEAVLLPEITSRLRSDDLATVAWGAHLAAKYRVTEAAPILRTALAELADRPQAAGRFAELALLDALLQTDAVLTTEELAPFRTGLGGTAWLALLARDPIGNREALAHHFRQLDRAGAWIEWVATGNVLVTTRDADFVLALLERQHVMQRVVVRDAATTETPAARTGGRRGRGRNVASIEVPPSQPPTVLYELTLDGRPGDVLFARGEHTVFLRRHVHEQRTIRRRDHESHTLGDPERQRLAWLARMLEQTVAELPFAVECSLTVSWHGAEKLQADLQEARADVLADFRRLVAVCVEAKLVARAATTDLAPTIEIRWDDRRGDQSEPLPAVGTTANGK